MSSKFVSSESGDPIIIKYNLIINCNHVFDNNVSIIFSRWMHFQPASFCDIIYFWKLQKNNSIHLKDLQQKIFFDFY